MLEAFPAAAEEELEVKMMTMIRDTQQCSRLLRTGFRRARGGSQRVRERGRVSRDHLRRMLRARVRRRETTVYHARRKHTQSAKRKPRITISLIIIQRRRRRNKRRDKYHKNHPFTRGSLRRSVLLFAATDRSNRRRTRRSVRPKTARNNTQKRRKYSRRIFSAR